MNEIDFKGKLELGHNVKIGYFAQNQAQLLDENLTVFETIDNVAVGDIRTKIRDILGAFMFGGEASDKKVKVLSGGERSRLAMIRLLLEPVNLLILDEPTNHLDMKTKDILKQAIKDFDGTAIVVSHDRDFLNGLVDKVYEFGGGKVKEHLGGIYEFLERKKMESLQELEMQSPTPSDKNIPNDPQKDNLNKLSYEERKELSRQIKRVEKQIQDTEQAIEQEEGEIKEIERLLATPEKAADASLFERHGILAKEIEAQMKKWEELTMELENLKTNV